MFDNFFKLLFGDRGNNGNRNSLFNINFGNRNNNNFKFIYKLVNFEEAKNMIKANQVILIDVRSKQEYDIMHIENAINIPVDDIEKLIFKYEQITPLMVYCSSGSRTKKAIQILNSLGYTNIYIWEYGALATFPHKNMLIYENVNSQNRVIENTQEYQNYQGYQNNQSNQYEQYDQNIQNDQNNQNG